MKNYIIVIYIMLLYCCTTKKDEGADNICKGPITTKVIYRDQADSTTYTKIDFYCSGDTCAKYVFKNNSLEYSIFWNEFGEKKKEEHFFKQITLPYDGKDSDVIAVMKNIGVFKEWNKKGVLVYETKILSGNKMLELLRDSVGNVLKIDTISY